MALKKRTPKDDAARAAAIEAFADGADLPPAVPIRPAGENPSAAVAPPSAAPAAASVGPVKVARNPASPANAWPADVAKNLLLRYNEADLPQMLKELAALEDRSQHAMGLRALRRGVQELLNEARER